MKILHLTGEVAELPCPSIDEAGFLGAFGAIRTSFI